MTSETRSPAFVTATSFFALFSIVGLALYGLPLYYDFMVRDFGWSRTMVTSGNALSKLVVGPLFGFVAGWIVDRFGPRRLMMAGILMAGGALIGLGAMSAAWMFYLFYFFNALGYVCGGPLPNQVLLSRWFDKARGRAMGIAYLGIGIGGALVPLLANRLTQQFGWRGSLQALGVIMILIALPFAYLVTDRSGADGTEQARNARGAEQARPLQDREAVRNGDHVPARPRHDRVAVGNEDHVGAELALPPARPRDDREAVRNEDHAGAELALPPARPRDDREAVRNENHLGAELALPPARPRDDREAVRNEDHAGAELAPPPARPRDDREGVRNDDHVGAELALPPARPRDDREAVRNEDHVGAELAPPRDRGVLREVLAQPAFYLLAIGSMCSIAAVGGTNQHLKLFLSLDRGYDQADAARIISLVLAISIAGRLFMGWLADRVTRKYVMLLIYLLVAAAIPLLLAGASWSLMTVFALVFGLGLGGEYLIIPLMAAELFGVAVLGRVMGIVLTLDGVAEATAPMLVGYLRDRSGSYDVGFGTLVATAVLGAIAVALLPRRGDTRATQLITVTTRNQLSAFARSASYGGQASNRQDS